MTAEQQQAMDSFYGLDNVITIKITMPASEWDKVRLEEPKGGRCEWDWTGGSRYTWRKADTVEISGTRFPATTTFTDIGIKKKSFCGSIDDKKPCIHIDFGRFSSTAEDAAEALIGTRYVTLNNSKQDKSYIRQTLGYRMLQMVGPAQFSVQLRPRFRQWNPRRPRARQRNVPGDLRQRRADHEAPHRTQLTAT